MNKTFPRPLLAKSISRRLCGASVATLILGLLDRDRVIRHHLYQLVFRPAARP